jgi:hypothetical protein
MIKISICDTAPEGACSYYRSIGPLSQLRKINPDIQVEYLNNVSWPILSNTDILYLERPVENNLIKSIEMARQMGIKVWVDFDDCLHEIPKDNPSYDYFKLKISGMERSLDLADVITMSTPAMKQYYETKNFNKDSKEEIKRNIHIVENAHNDYLYPFNHIEKTVDFINWRGSATHRQDLLSCVRAMHDVAMQFPQWGWTFVGNDIWFVTDGIKNHFNLKETDVISYNQFIRELMPAIQIVPLLNTLFTHAKSNIAWLEGTWVGAATLAPDIPEFLRPGVINYKAEDNDNFAYYLEKMIKSTSFRKENYEISFEYIRKNLLLSQINKKRIEILEGLL